MQNKFIHSRIKSAISRTRNSILTLASVYIAVGAATSVSAQVVSLARQNVKHFSTAYFPGTDNYVMGGTFFDNAGHGTMKNLLFYSSNIPSGCFYYSSGMNTDERVVSTKVINGNEVLMISHRRDLSTVNNIGDRIVVTKVDGSGNILSSKMIDDLQDGYNLHPMHSITNSTDRLLYICGYTTEYVGSSQPQPVPVIYNTQRHSFVMIYDLLAERAVLTRIFESTNNAGLDVDMATRMKFLSNGDLFVTGSSRSSTGDPGVLCLSLDPSTLLPNISKCVAKSNSTTPGGPYIFECGFDIAEAADGSGYYLFSNMTLPINAFSTDLPIGQNFAVTKIDNGFNPSLTGNSRAEWNNNDNTIGVNLIDGIHPDPTLVNTNVVLSATVGAFPTGGGSQPYNLDHFSPMITEMNLSTDLAGNLIISHPFVSLLPTTAGTGNFHTDPNSYHNLGGFYSSEFWQPVTTARDLSTGINDITLNSPIWDINYNVLALKYIRTDEFGMWLGTCPNDNAYNVTYWHMMAVLGQPITESLVRASTRDIQELSDTISRDHVFDCSPSYYRGSALPEKYSENYLALYPNPANDKITVKWMGDYNSTSTEPLITLTDITGRIVSTSAFTKGSAELTIRTANVPAGIYLVNVQNAGSTQKPLKLTVVH